MNEQKLRHYERLDRFIQSRLETDLYPEPVEELHLSITRQMIDKLDALRAVKNQAVLDVGCGQGVALEIFRQKGAKAIGVTMGTDYQVCREKGLEVYEMDQSFLDFPQASFDVVWCRHAIEHSLFPLFTLHGLGEVLKHDGLLYIEVPEPSTPAHHENNPNHYACFTPEVWRSLFTKANFAVRDFFDIAFHLPCGLDRYHAFFLQKRS